MLGAIIFCAAAVAHGSSSIERRNKELAEQAVRNKRFARDISRSYLRKK